MGEGISRAAALAAAAAFLVLYAGSLVTSTGSGDAVPDWWFAPISHGTLLPDLSGGTGIEHPHRVVGFLAGITAFLAAWAASRSPRPGVRALGRWAVYLVLAQGLLGGARVRWGAPGGGEGARAGFAIAHACLGQAYFGLLVALATAASPRWAARRADLPGAGFARLSLAATAALFGQIVLGALMRHTGTGLAGHLIGAVIAAAAAAATTVAAEAAGHRAQGKGEATPPFVRPARFLAGLLGIQIVLGIATFAIVGSGFIRSPEAPFLYLLAISGHLLTGALMFATSLRVTLLAWPAVRADAKERTAIPKGWQPRLGIGPTE